SGTFVGVTRRLRELNPAIRCISLQPDAPFHGLEGWKHMETAIRPSIYDDTLADENLEVGTEDSYHLVNRIAREPQRGRRTARLLPRSKEDSARSARRDRHRVRRLRRKISHRAFLGR